MQERQIEKVANLVANSGATAKGGASTPQDATITADKHTVTYRATVPPGTTDDQMQKIVQRLDEKVRGGSGSSATVNGQPLSSVAGKGGAGATGVAGKVGGPVGAGGPGAGGAGGCSGTTAAL